MSYICSSDIVEEFSNIQWQRSLFYIQILAIVSSFAVALNSIPIDRLEVIKQPNFLENAIRIQRGAQRIRYVYYWLLTVMPAPKKRNEFVWYTWFAFYLPKSRLIKANEGGNWIGTTRGFQIRSLNRDLWAVWGPGGRGLGGNNAGSFRFFLSLN